jgi:hypothetical protein
VAVFVVIVFWLAVALVGRAIGKSRGRPELGFWISLLVGPLGWVLVLFLPEAEVYDDDADCDDDYVDDDDDYDDDDETPRCEDPLESLERLGRLRASGLLTEEEFVSEKSLLLKGKPVQDLEKLERIARLRAENVLLDSEYQKLRRAMDPSYAVILDDFGASNRKVQKTVNRLRAGLKQPPIIWSPSRYVNLPIPAVEGLPEPVARQWAEELVALGAVVHLD